MQKSGYQIFHIPISNRLKFIIHFYSFLKKEKFDVVHIHVYGLRDLVEDSKNGFVIETNPDMLADKLEILYSNEILRKQFGANGYEYVKKEYNMKTSLDKMIQIYEEKK